jgi:hypothetical protein
MFLLRYAMLVTILTAVVMSVSFFTSLFAQQGVPDEPRPTAAQVELPPIPEDAVEVQTSGPIHEGFATPLTTEVPESIVVKKEPPQPIEELPPEQKPEGENVVWIPGYFAWDEDRRDFIWISGFWRDVPPGRVWVSGYWGQNAEGWQWVPGFWTSGEQNEVTYLPPPPETIETGPSIEQPSVNHFWVPGHWHWVDSRYAWRAGYWSRINPDWVWIPAHYVWCPSGYVFVDGYWDYPVVRRGLLFAPAYFQPVAYRRPYYFTPSIVWSTHLLTDHLWVRPAYYHYYFGDFYHDRYANWGIRPWYLSFTFGNTSYDPLFSYYRWRYRDNDWAGGVRERYDFYRRNEARRPPRTYRDLQQAVARADNREAIRNLTVAAPITQIVNNTTVNNVTAGVIKANFDTPFRFDRMAQSERRQAARRADELRGVVRQRRQVETRENVARVEGGKREGAKAGEDTRERRAAPRSLNIGEVVKAIDATPDRRGRGATKRAGDDQQASRRSGEREPQRGRGVDVRSSAAPEGATGRVRPRPERAAEPAPEIARPDRGPDLGQPGAARPDATAVDRVGGGRGRGDDQRPSIATPDRRPDVRAPDFAPDLRGRGASADVKVRDRAKTLEDRARDVARPDGVRPDAGSERPMPRGRRPERPQLPTLPGDQSEVRIPERDIEPPTRRGSALPQRNGTSRGAINRGADRAVPRPTLPGFGDPSTTLRQPRFSGPEPANAPSRERASATRGRGSSPVPDFSGMARPPQSRSRADRPDQVAPLRLGGPQPSPRAAQTPRVDSRALERARAEQRPEPRAGRRPEPRAERPTPRVERPSPRPTGPSARTPAGESRSKGRSEEAKREKDRD